MSTRPKNVQIIGTELAILWPDGSEDYLPHDFLRAASPSAETKGETDILGNVHGGEFGKDYTGITITGWDWVGNYAMRLIFSDGHQTGLFSWEYLQKLAEARKDEPAG